MLPRYLHRRWLPQKNIGSDESDVAQSSTHYMVETELLGVIATLPLSCRDIIFSQRGLVAQLALIALMEKEKFGKNYGRVRRASRRNYWLVKRLLRKLQPKAKNKIVRKVLKKEKRRGRVVLFNKIKPKSHRKKSASTKLAKKGKATVKKQGRKKNGLRLRGRVKYFKRGLKRKTFLKISRGKVKRSGASKGLSKLVTKGKVKSGVVAVKKKNSKVSVKGKGKLFFLKKPGAKDIDKFKKQVAKKVKAKAYQKQVINKKVRQLAKDSEQEAKLKQKVSFFKATAIKKASNADSKSEKRFK